MPEVTFQLEVSSREFDTVLAALRVWQSRMLMGAWPGSAETATIEQMIAEDHGPKLTRREVGQLCLRLQGGTR